MVKTWHQGICGYFPCRRLEAHSDAPAEQVHNTYLYLQSAEHSYLYTFHLRVASYLLTPGCVFHLCGQICLLCILTIIIFIFCCSPCGVKLQGINDRSSSQRRHDSNIKLFKDFFCCVVQGVGTVCITVPCITCTVVLILLCGILC